MANLLENYKGRLAVSESYYAKSHEGEKMSQGKKLVVARLLENVNKFLNESFENSVGTQRSDMGAFRKFCMNLTTVAVPNLIAFDLVFVSPMTSMTGNIAYQQYVLGSNKGQSKRGTVINSPFGLGSVDPDYTSEKVVETSSGSSLTLAWTPVVKGSFTDEHGTKHDVKIIKAGTGVIEYKDVDDVNKPTVNSIASGDRVAYVYDNVTIPQNDLPIINMEMKNIALYAKPRRIAIYYSQLAQFLAKQDYGFDLGEQLAEKAVGELSYKQIVA